jgi:prepilin-type N-terminal cleavage/methylation domain-containing protein
MVILGSLIFTKQLAQKSRGFTLLEILVVIGIIGILSGIAVGYSRTSSQQLSLLNAEAKLLNLFSRAKFLSVETFLTAEEGGLRVCAYGVKVDRSQGEVFIFADRAPSCPANNLYNSDTDLRLSSELDNFKLNPALFSFTEDTTLSEVVFIPPDPRTKINNSDSESAALGIKLNNNLGRLKLMINNAGQIKTE